MSVSQPEQIREKHADGIDETGGSRLRRLPPVWSIESACFARVFLWFQAVLSIYVSPLWISKSSSMIINISGVLVATNWAAGNAPPRPKLRNASNGHQTRDSCTPNMLIIIEEDLLIHRGDT